MAGSGRFHVLLNADREKSGEFAEPIPVSAGIGMLLMWRHTRAARNRRIDWYFRTDDARRRSSAMVLRARLLFPRSVDPARELFDLLISACRCVRCGTKWKRRFDRR